MYPRNYVQIDEAKYRQMDTWTEVTCTRCLRSPQYSFVHCRLFVIFMCYERCGYVFWTIRQCPKCKVLNHTKLINKPRNGELITCKRCSYSFYYIRCPKDNCEKLQQKRVDKFAMCEKNTCEKCEKQFKLLVCQCGGLLYFQPNEIIYQGAHQYKCKQCQKNIVFLICPECGQLDYCFQKQELGEKVKCSNCKQTRAFVPCPNCGKSINSKNFYYGETQTCEFCKTDFQFVMCPNGCGINYYMGKQLETPYRNCKTTCGKSCVVINCTKCKSPFFIDDYDFGLSRLEECSFCKAQIKFHLCQCGTLNKDSNKCRNDMCPIPEGVKSYTKQWKDYNQNMMAKKKMGEQNTSDYDIKICKLCFDAQSCMINQSCRHMMMCEKCYVALRRTHPNDFVRCPTCKQPGKYHPYKQPILQ